MTERQTPASRAAQTNGTSPAVPRGSSRAGAATGWVDDRVGLAGALNTRLFTLRKVSRALVVHVRGDRVVAALRTVLAPETRAQACAVAEEVKTYGAATAANLLLAHRRGEPAAESRPDDPVHSKYPGGLLAQDEEERHG